MSLLIRRIGSGEDWHDPEVRGFENENELQKIITHWPSLLPGVERSGALALQEVILSGECRVDILCVDLDGTITLCECKLHTSTEMRRTIVGQLTAYAAAVWKMSYEDFASRLGTDLVSGMQRLADESKKADWSEIEFQTTVRKNLAQGLFQLVFAVDEITDELKQIVEYLNLHTVEGIEVQAVEIGHVQHSGMEILTPTTYGVELGQSKAGRSRKERWDRASFVAALRLRSAEAAVRIEAVMDWAEGDGAISFYGAGNDGSWYPVWRGKKLSDAPIDAWTSGSICINFAAFRHRPGFDDGAFRHDLGLKLAGTGWSLRPRKDDAPIDGLGDLDYEGRQRLIAVLEWVKQQFYGPLVEDPLDGA
jgi:hypothetical protein